MTSQTDVAWAAGLFEGEGTWLTRRGGAQAALSSTDLDVVERFAAVVGMGRIRAYEERSTPGGLVKPGAYKARHTWNVTNARDVRALIEMLWPYLGERRRSKAQEILDATQHANQNRSRYATHCRHGHEFTESNTYWTPKGLRRCRTCQREDARRRYQQAKKT